MSLVKQEQRAPFHGKDTQTPKVVNTTCAYCGVGCGVDIRGQGQTNGDVENALTLEGTPDHPANFGNLCVKGSKLLETNDLTNRLLVPQVFGQEADWQQATELVASKFKHFVDEYGPESVAFYVSGQLLTEDYYVANKLMKGFIGSANIDTNSRLCMSSAVAAYKRAFGADSVPCSYEDLEQTDLLVLIGSNAAWTHPVLFQRIERARQINPEMKLVFIDPRKTASCELADLHLPIKPGTDVALFNGLLRFLQKKGQLDEGYIDAHTEGFKDAQKRAEAWTPQQVADFCDLPIEQVDTFYNWFGRCKRALSFYSMGVNQSSSGVDKANAIINCHLATGKIGRQGCGPFSITGQPNAMGGREVGGLSNMLAAHMDIENPQHRRWAQQFWNSPTICTKAGLKAIDLFESMEQGKVKAVWIMATNPLVSMPNRAKITRALENCEFVVVSDCVSQNDTLALADVKLPATAWSEKEGTVTNSERRISRQRAFTSAPGQAKHDWQIICDVAQKMGFDNGFDFQTPHQIFIEHARLSGFNNHGDRDFDISAMADLNLQEYQQLKPVQWPVNATYPDGCKRLFTDGRFFTPSGKARFIALQPELPVQQTCVEFPFILNSGRIRDQWHTMTRTGKAVSLNKHINQPFIAMHPDDAARFELVERDLVYIASSVSRSAKKNGNSAAAELSIQLPVKIDRGQRKGELFVPIHWSRSNSSSAAIGVLFGDACDVISGQPELKHGAVNIIKLEYQLHGQIFSRSEIPTHSLNALLEFWSSTPIEGGYMYQFASNKQKLDIYRWLNQVTGFEAEWLVKGSEDYAYIAALQNKTLLLATFISHTLCEIDIRWIEALFKQETIEPEQLTSLLNARPDERFLQGPLVCSCFSVGKNAIVKAIESGCNSVEALGYRLKCGTNCGSCKSELHQLLNHHKDDNHIITLGAV